MGVASNPSNLAKFGIIDPRDYGAVADGTTDCTAAFNAAYAAANPGQTIMVPQGTWLFAGNVTATPGVTLRGSHEGICQTWAGGTIFSITGGAGISSAGATPFLTITHCSIIDGIIFNYPNQSAYDNSKVVAYPYTVGVDYGVATGNPIAPYWSIINPEIRNCTFNNSYQAIRLWGAMQFNIDNVNINTFINGIWADQMWDTSCINKVKIEPGPFNDGGAGAALHNMVGIRAGHCDSLIIRDTLVLMAATGLLFENSTHVTSPNVPWIIASGIVIDVCDIGIDVQAISGLGIHYSDSTITTSNGSPDSIAMRVGSGAGAVGGVLTVSNTILMSWQGRELRVSGGRSRFVGCTFSSYGNSPTGSSTSVVVTGGDCTVTSCDFADARPQMDFSGGGKAVFADNTTGSNGVSVTGVTPSNCI